MAYYPFLDSITSLSIKARDVITQNQSKLDPKHTNSKIVPVLDCSQFYTNAPIKTKAFPQPMATGLKSILSPNIMELGSPRSSQMLTQNTPNFRPI